MDALETTAIASYESEAEPELSSKAKAIYIGVAIVVALFSAFILGGHFTQPEAYPTTIQTLDSKRTVILGLAAAATTASVAVSALPDDTGTPLSDSLAELAGSFALILSAVLLQKYLLTTFGMISFQFLIPISCLIFILAVLRSGDPARRNGYMNLAGKLLALAIVLFACVPAGAAISNNIEATYQSSIDQAIEQAQGTAAAADQSAAQDQGDAKAADGEATPLDGIVTFLDDAKNTVTNKVSEVVDMATGAANSLLEAFAVMLVTVLFIPVLTLALMLWLASLILGVNINIPIKGMKPRFLGKLGSKRN